MKDFFENFGKRFGETAEMVTNKAGEMIEIQRVKSQIRDLARENAVDMMELGKAVYERYKSGEELDDSTAQICDSIKEREKEIEKYERKIAVLKGSAACVKCGRMVSEDMAYCPYCGEKMEARDMEEATEEYAEKVKEKAADVAEAMADKAEETAKKIGEAAQKAAYKTEEVLEKLRSKHPIVGKILEQRGIRKLLSTYINALPELINPTTGKIHTSFNQTVTATGRLYHTQNRRFSKNFSKKFLK